MMVNGVRIVFFSLIRTLGVSGILRSLYGDVQFFALVKVHFSLVKLVR
jgi:hypothetical protein